MTGQMKLLDVPKMAPSREELSQREIEYVKAQHGIWTHKSGAFKRGEHPWTALLLATGPCGADIPYSAQMQRMTPMEMIAGYCRVLDEHGLLTTGETEREAMEELMSNCHLIWPKDRRAKNISVARSFLMKEIRLREFPKRD